LVYEDESDRFAVISGTRRLEALNNLRWDSAEVLVIGPDGRNETISPLSKAAPSLISKLLKIVACENEERGFNNAERALIAPLASSLPPGRDRDKILATFGLFAQNHLQGALIASKMPKDFLDALACAILDLENILAMENWSLKGQKELLRLFSKLSLSYQKRKIWIDLISDLFLRDRIDIAQYLSQSPFTNLSPDREEIGRDYLFAKRFPEISSYRAMREELIKDLALPSGTRLDFKANLEDIYANLSFSFTSQEDLKRQLTVLSEIAQSNKFLALWNLPWEKKPK
jgi:hypothetical protein